jgi:hypothetical protein
MGSALISQVHSANSGYLHAKSDLLYYGLARIAYYAEIEPLIRKLDKLFSADTSLGVNSEFPYIPPEYDTLLSIGTKLAAMLMPQSTILRLRSMRPLPRGAVPIF